MEETDSSSSSSGRATAMAMTTPRGCTLTGDVIMARLGVYDLVSTKELILRDESITCIDESCARALASLEVLSLSHNRLASLEHFEHLTNIIELNLNFNQIASLANLQASTALLLCCAGLEKLFVANNKITDISPLRTFQKLNTLSLYGNQIADLDAALHTCRAFPKLRALDLGGNPCSRQADGYKFQAVRVLPRLKTLDGELVTQLDKDLAEDFAVNNGSKRGSSQPSTLRPFTAPAGSASDRLRAARWDAPTPKAFDPFASKDMPRGNVRLFRDDFLNNNPILLEYLVEDAHAAAPLDGDGVVSQTRAKFQDDSSDSNGPDADAASGTAGFVGKMRSANPLRDANATDNESVPDSSDSDYNGLERPTTASTTSSVLTSHFSIDPSDPKTTIRKLLKHIEILMETIASQKNRQIDACGASLLDEIDQLQIENNNIPILQEQIAELKKQLAAAGTAHSSAAELKRAKDLELENAALKRENARLKQSQASASRHANGSPDVSLIDRAMLNADGAGHRDSAIDLNGGSSSSPVFHAQRLASTELLDESASIDLELTELILHNEVSLEMIRNEIKSTKREWEVQLQHAKDTARARPSTALDLSSAAAAMRSDARQLHTSAGVRNSSQQQAAAVFPLAARGTSSRSTTNILTL